jgi:ferrous iron transport protein B
MTKLNNGIFYHQKEEVYSWEQIASAGVLLILHFSGFLERIRDAFAPLVVQGMGLPKQAADLLLMTVARREVGAVMMKDMVDTGELSLKQIFVGLLVMTLFVPCMSNTLLLGRAVGWIKTGVIFAGVTAIAIGAGIGVNMIWI